jgi:hypothetical protein
MELFIKHVIKIFSIIGAMFLFAAADTGNIPLQEPSVIQNIAYYRDMDISGVPQNNQPPLVDDPKVLQSYQIPNSPKGELHNKFDILAFHNFITALFEHNDNAQEIFYQKKIEYLLNEIQKDKYGFDLFVDAYARTGSYISAQQTNLPAVQQGAFDESGVGTTLHADKLLYDGEYSLVKREYDILNKRLANIKVLNAKEKLFLFGMNIYSNLYISQEQLEFFKQMHKQQADMYEEIEKTYNLGAASTLNYIDAKNDLLNLQKAVLSLTYKHLHNEFILKHSIKSQSEKKFRLKAMHVNLSFDSLSDLQKQAIQNSSDIALELNKLKINETDFLAAKKRYYPTVRFNSYLGYGTANNEVFFKKLNNTGFSPFWELGVVANFPIYNRGDIELNKEKELNNILLQKAVLSAKTREILIEVERSYHMIEMIKQQREILSEQAELLEKKVDVASKLYRAGAAQYRDYSDAMKNYLESKVGLVDIEQQYIKESLFLAILIGRKDLYE